VRTTEGPRLADTPEDVRVTWQARTPVPTDRADLGIALDPARPPHPPRPHRLVVLGDSLSHGFKHGAVFDTHLSWPAILARALGVDDFRFPTYDGPLVAPGLPINLEYLARALDDRLPSTWLDILGDVQSGLVARAVMDEVEDHWERGSSATPPPADAPVNHNLAVWGFDIRDALSKTAGRCRAAVAEAGDKDQRLNQIPSAPGERSALRALAGAGDDDAAVDLAARLGTEGIDTLVVALGANNMLGTVLSFDLRWSDEGFDDPDRKRAYNAWTPEHFVIEYERLVRRVDDIDADRVILWTVPHVTIAPMLRGVGEKMPGSRYFPRYTRPWIDDRLFDARRHPCLTGDQARIIDSTIDQYNVAIEAHVAAKRRAGKDWLLFDAAGILDRLAYRRYVLDPRSRPDWWTPYELPEAYLDLSPVPDTRNFLSDVLGRTQGGLIGLDHIHPTTIGYGLVARELLEIMKRSDLSIPRALELPFAEIAAADSLVDRPPASLAPLYPLLGEVMDDVNWFQVAFGGQPV
jgi:hypothetical protein